MCLCHVGRVCVFVVGDCMFEIVINVVVVFSWLWFVVRI